ncbi:MAG TPA: alpha/beta fold hydrolase [Thermomicrobiales bacterium]|nr:alpha/beta fold hydrolase [Thermomicrobiales bacterium]
MPKATVGDLEVTYDLAGSGPPLVMINGIGSPRSGWDLQVPVLSRYFTVLTFDNRDVGETGAGSDPRPYEMKQFADDLAGLMDAIGWPSAHIVGASMGGAIAQEFAVNYPDRTRSVTIVCSWPKSDPWMVELMSQWDDVFANQGRVAWDRTTWLWVFTHRFFDADPSPFPGLLADSENMPFPQTLECYLRQSAAFKAFDIIGRLPSISAPAHVIVGEEDIYTPLRYSIDIANAIPGATLTVIPEAGHGVFWEQAAKFDRVLGNFLLEVEQGANGVD